MRANDARKWLHAGLDLLPLILIPVFMIYSHMHTIDSGSIEVPINRVVDFNQNITNPQPNSINDYYAFPVERITVEYDNYQIKTTINDLTGSNYERGTFYQYTNLNDFSNHKLLVRLYVSSTIDTFALEFGSNFIASFNSNQLSSVVFDCPDVLYNGQILWYPYTSHNVNDIYYTKYLNCFDLTRMFGAGNEPTAQQFNQWFTDDYYDYTLSRKELLKGYSTHTYDDTDIMSQFTYQLYNSVDKYFNMGNVFNLGGVYDWFNLNIFAGNAPIALYIVWNIVLYEFVMDLLFLLYALFMWFIDVTKRLIEKPLDSIK